MSTVPILVLNSGSSSLKFGLYTGQDRDEIPILDGLIDGVGTTHSRVTLKDADGKTIRAEDAATPSLAKAFETADNWLAEHLQQPPQAIGHRVVHGGAHITEHQRITAKLLDELRDSIHFAPLHIPLSLELIQSAKQRYPDVPQFACFDTVFHRNMPQVAAHLPLPTDLFDEGIRRYGFHGLSYESIVHQLGPHLGPRTVIAHLGSGASLCAVKDGTSIDTSMGLTPTGGIPMATRIGDLDPGVLLFLMRNKNMSADALEDMLNHSSGLVAISDGIKDMRELESASASGNAAAQLAIDVFCTAIAKTIAAYAVSLNGLDMLIFSGGIGEHSTMVRERVCNALSFLGMSLDKSANSAHTSIISADSSSAAIHITESQEDRQIARHSRTLLDTSP